MNRERLKLIFKLFAAVVLFFVGTAALLLFAYLKVLPWAVSQPKVVSYIENTASKALGTDVYINQPILKTELSPEIYFSVNSVQAANILDIKNLNANISIAQVSSKNIIIKNVNLDYIFADVNKITDLPVFKLKKPSTKSNWNVDIFQSVLNVKKAQINYLYNKDTYISLKANDLHISDEIKKKYIKFKIAAKISKNKNSVNIDAYDNGGVYIKDGKTIIIKNSIVKLNGVDIDVCGNINKKYEFNTRLIGKNTSIPVVITLLDSQIIENNLSKELTYFKDIDGNFDFTAHFGNKKFYGDLNLNKLSFKLIPFQNLPILLNSGKVKFTEKDIYLKDFKGFYNNRPDNKMDFSGSVRDYIKSVDTDLTGNAVVTNDFTENYLSKMVNYPIQMKGIADTRVMLKSKYGKIDLTWLYRFKQGNGFLFDGEETFMNDTATRVLVAKMHFENMLLNIKSIDYHAGRPGDDKKEVKVPLLNMFGNIDFSNGKTFVKDFGLSLPKPMPSGFLNMLIKQQLFRNGTFTGHMRVINTGKYPVLEGEMKADKVGIPSQRLFIKEGIFKTDKDNMHISANGRYRRSAYDMTGVINNEIKFPILVKNLALTLESVDIEKYLQIFNQQNPTEAAQDVKVAVSNSVAKGGDIDDDTTEQTFDLANLIVEECILKAKSGFYKGINFSNVIATLKLDKNSLLKITTNLFEIAEGYASANSECDLRNHKYSLGLMIRDVNSDIIATSLLNLSKEIYGKASGLIKLDADDSLKLNGRIQFRVHDGVIAKIGLVEYVMKVASLFRNPLAMISPSVFSDLVSVPEGKFDLIDGDLKIKNNIILPMIIKSSAPQLSSYIVGTYNLENQDSSLRIYTKFSNRKKGLFGMFRNISLNALANRIPMSSRNDTNYYESEISKLPPIEADEKDCQIFLTKVDGDIEHNNFISSLKKIK